MLSSKNLIAAVDIGSNSIRLEIWRLDQGQHAKVEYHKEVARMGLGLDSDRNLTRDCMQRAWDCLARFGERLADFQIHQISAVATQTLREAKNRDEFLSKGSKLLGCPIAVISGPEEARLIYKGVDNYLPRDGKNRLVIDIGGRSTELILANGAQTIALESYRLGSASWSGKYFPDGDLSESSFERAEVAAKAVLDEAIQQYALPRWDNAYGSSGTIGALADICIAQDGVIDPITVKDLRNLKRLCIKAGKLADLELPGLKEERRLVIPGGLSVLTALFELLKIDQLHASEGALRHGLLLDMIERSGNRNEAITVREQSIARLQLRFSVDALQAARVSKVAGQLFVDLNQAKAERLPEAKATVLNQQLQWAAQVHELGGVISHSDYHKHGAYVLDNSDAIGFSLPELHRMSLLVLGHRGKLRKLDVDWSDVELVRQIFALRLAVLFCHARRDPDIAPLRFSQSAKQFNLAIPVNWAQQYPQSTYLLQQESIAWQKTGWVFSVTS